MHKKRVLKNVILGGTNTGGEVRYEYMILKYEYKPIHTQKIPSIMYSVIAYIYDKHNSLQYPWKSSKLLAKKTKN